MELVGYKRFTGIKSARLRRTHARATPTARAHAPTQGKIRLDEDPANHAIPGRDDPIVHRLSPWVPGIDATTLRDVPTNGHDRLRRPPHYARSHPEAPSGTEEVIASEHPCIYDHTKYLTSV